MDHILVTPEMISDAAASCDTTATDIDGELAALRSYVVNLQGIWHGVASDQFNILMHDFDVFGKMLHDALTDIASGLRGNFVNYVDAEQANVSSLVAVNGDIPGARL
ncbi:WXG100 family type VII secretion target [Micromonospora sp. NPDC000089]|uniref:WXG100 family type VII secretion target n=1 Tax=unclassified Micromonospora TaxID=2617518 RepID=UPI0036B9BEDD